MGAGQDFKLATQDDNESIGEKARWVRTLGQCAYATLADADRQAIQRDQFMDVLTHSDIQESFWKEDTDGFGPTLESALLLKSINKARQMKHRRRATPVVRHAYYEDGLNLEFRRPSGINAVMVQGAVAVGQH